jgi:hypothetical protein
VGETELAFRGENGRGARREKSRTENEEERKRREREAKEKKHSSHFARQLLKRNKPKTKTRPKDNDHDLDSSSHSHGASSECVGHFMAKRRSGERLWEARRKREREHSFEIDAFKVIKTPTLSFCSTAASKIPLLFCWFDALT